MEKTSIYVATHKLFLPPLNSIYKPIVSGAIHNKLPYLSDNRGENISNRNLLYAELTVLYWMWKNDHSQYVGLNHYHRYFFEEKYITKKEIQTILKQADFIVPKPISLDCSVYEQYASVHYKNDLLLACQEIIKNDHSYQPSIEEVLGGDKLYSCNMFITRKELLDDYASFLFPILFSLENQIPYLMYSKYNQRVFGFLAERIFTIYLRKNNFSLEEYSVKDTLSLKVQNQKRVRILKNLAFDNENGRSGYIKK